MCQYWEAHVLKHNWESVGICLVGGMAEDGTSENNFTNNQMAKTT